jgi:hypothetical protein
MQVFLLILTIVFLGIVPPVFLIAIATPWSFNAILVGWSLLVAVIGISSWPWYKNHAGL